MAISWGTRIIFLYVGFILLIGTLVWKSTQTKFDLVSEDYYEQEVGFQKKLDARGASAALPHKPVVSVTDKAVLIFFPQEFSDKAIQADLKLYSPANASLDKSLTGLAVNKGRVEISRDKLPAIPYILQLSWSSEGQSYYQEFPLNLSWK